VKNPKEALEALADPAPLTLGQIALLDLYESPLLHGEIDDLSKVTFSLWLLSMPTAQAVAEAKFPDRAIVWADGITPAEYDRRLVDALAAIAAFYHILPRPESGEDDAIGGLKKKRAAASATATSPSSSRCSAGSTGGRSATRSRRSRPSRPASSTAPTRRGREG
jgi:hypothetical protein